MLKFPDSPSFTGFNQPARFEADITDVETEGDIPTEMDGAFYRVQPDPQYPPMLGDDIAFNGDGSISMFRFKDGRVHFKQRWVQTDKFKLERAAGKGLFGAYRNPLKDDASVKGKIRGTANTNAFPFAGKLFALKEDSPPVVMDLNTLETKGYTDFGGKMKSQTFTAHPKVDPETGEMVGFGYAAKGLFTKDMAYYTFNKHGEVTRETWFELPYYCMMHDFGVTKDYAVFHVVPCVGSWERIEAGLPHFGFDTTKDVYLGILPRDGEGRDVRWFKAPNCFASHVMNAHNVGTKIHFDTPQAKNNMFPFFPDVHGAPFNIMEAHSRLTRWTVDMNSNSDAFESQTVLSELFGEFPRIDDRYATKHYRHGYMLVMDMAKPFDAPGGKSGAGLIMNTLAHYDHATGRTQTWWCGPTSTLQEPCFVPKGANAPEGEGYIVQVCNRLNERVSDLLVFDAQRISEGPIATAKLGVRLRFGLHGNWAPGSMLS